MSKPKKLRDLRSAGQLTPPKLPRRPAKVVRGPAPRLFRVGHASRAIRLTRMIDSLPMRALRRFVMRLFANIVELSLYTVIAVAIGFGSAWYMVDYGSSLTVERQGPWLRWTIAGAPGADPYTKAHFSRAGWLPISTVAAHYYLAGKDSSGDALYADCDYTVSGPIPSSHRWTLAAFDISGRTIANGPGQPVIASSAALPGPEATLIVKLSQTTSSGNWLGLSGSGRMQLMLALYGRNDRSVRATGNVLAAPARQLLPRIERTGCR